MYLYSSIHACICVYTYININLSEETLKYISYYIHLKIKLLKFSKCISKITLRTDLISS